MAPKAAPKAAEKPKAEAKAKPKAKPKKEAEGPSKEDLIPKVEQPDRNAFEESIKVKNDELDALQKELAAASKKISEKSTGKDEFFAKKAELRRQLDEISEKMNVFQAQKDSVQKQVGDRQAEGKQLRQDLNKMKKNLGYTSEDQIEERIASIEFQMWTQSLSLKEEKKYLAEIQELKRNRPKVANF